MSSPRNDPIARPVRMEVIINTAAYLNLAVFSRTAGPGATTLNVSQSEFVCGPSGDSEAPV